MSISSSLCNTLPLKNAITPHAATNASWRDYPAGISGGHDAITTAAAKGLSERLSRLSEILFSDEIDVRVVDVRCKNGKGTELYVAK